MYNFSQIFCLIHIRFLINNCYFVIELPTFAPFYSIVHFLFAISVLLNLFVFLPLVFWLLNDTCLSLSFLFIFSHFCTISSDDYKEVVESIYRIRDEHLGTWDSEINGKDRKNQLEKLAYPWLHPCCGSDCRCCKDCSPEEDAQHAAEWKGWQNNLQEL